MSGSPEIQSLLKTSDFFSQGIAKSVAIIDTRTRRGIRGSPNLKARFVCILLLLFFRTELFAPQMQTLFWGIIFACFGKTKYLYFVREKGWESHARMHAAKIPLAID